MERSEVTIHLKNGDYVQLSCKSEDLAKNWVDQVLGSEDKYCKVESVSGEIRYINVSEISQIVIGEKFVSPVIASEMVAMNYHLKLIYDVIEG
ncbi:hypothetical protein [Enterococcus sp. HY326]|uniref:hypothetical protein n=1 Tax=Enterococcus sp. HY326 TaxID=2971265 RepID=UPI002240C5A5|nr:hypothetical protein [Enterococcus sp. HY326]